MEKDLKAKLFIIISSKILHIFLLAIILFPHSSRNKQMLRSRFENIIDASNVTQMSFYFSVMFMRRNDKLSSFS